MDISHNNLMWYSKGEKVIGVLSDFDMSRSRSDIEMDLLWSALGRPNPRSFVGTPPFVSCELFTPLDMPVQTYRHDLESFFWVLCFLCAVNNPEAKTYGHLEEWQQENRIQAAFAKAEFLCDIDADRALKTIIDPEVSYYMYQNVVQTWVKPLRSLFRPAGQRIFRDGFRLREMDGSITERQRSDLGCIEAEIACSPEPDFIGFMTCLGMDAIGM